jgi:hypothetical protein
MERSGDNATTRRFEDAYRRVDQQVYSGSIDPEDARWYLLAQQFRAQRAHERWLRHGAPRRRETDRAS